MKSFGHPRATIVRRHPLVCFFILAYGITWTVIWLGDLFPNAVQYGFLGRNLVPFGLPGQLRLFSMAAGYGPAIAGLVITAICTGRKGVREWLGSWVRWRVGWKWYVVALFCAPILFIVQDLATRSGGVFPRFYLHHAPATIRDRVLGFFLLIIPYLIWIAGEEGGWRGFALPRLQGRYGPVLASCILGVLWEAWHLPQILRPHQAYFDLGPTAVSLYLLRGLLIWNLFAIICTWIFNHSRGSLLPVILWHASTDAMADTERYLFPPSLYSLPGHAIGDWIIWPIVAIVIIWLTRGRLGYDPKAEAS